MSTVDNYENCNVCGGQGTLYSSFNCRTTEEHTFCTRCGANCDYLANRDENGKLILFEGKIDICIKKEIPSGGAWCVKDALGCGGVGVVPYGTTDTTELIASLEAHNEPHGAYHVVYLSLWHDGELEIVVGKDPSGLYGEELD